MLFERSSKCHLNATCRNTTIKPFHSHGTKLKRQDGDRCLPPSHPLQCAIYTKHHHLTFVEKRKSFFWCGPLVGWQPVQRRWLTERTAVRDTGYAYTGPERNAWIWIKSEQLRSSTFVHWMSSVSPRSSAFYFPTRLLRPFPPSLSAVHGNANSPWIKMQPIRCAPFSFSHAHAQCAWFLNFK